VVTLALMSVAGAAAGDGRMTALLVAQAAFYAAAVVGRRGGKDRQPGPNVRRAELGGDRGFVPPPDRAAARHLVAT
jgi:hypothetical protein